MEQSWKDLPLGFALGLAERPRAREHFTSLSPAEQAGWVARSRQVRSRREMDQLMRELEG